MKALKKAMSVLVSLLMIFTFALPAFADEVQHTITIQSKYTGHKFEAYQVLSGSYGEGNLGSVAWGSGVDGDALLTALTANSNFTNAASAADVAEGLSKLGENSKELYSFADIVSEHLTNVTATSTEANSVYTITVPADGYYFVKDTTVTENGPATRYLLKVVGADVKITAKEETPELDKKVKDANGDAQTAISANVGDTIPFELTSKVPDMGGYTTYSFVVKDTMSKGLTFNNDVVVKIDGQTYAVTTTATSNADGTTAISIDFGTDFINQTKGKDIVITYTATLNKEALKSDAVTNKAHLEYSNNPSTDGKGNTPDKETKVYDFDIAIDKYETDNENNKLSGAEFVLRDGDSDTAKYYKQNDDGSVDWVADLEDATVVTTDANGKASFTGLKAGTYYLQETKAPAGYNLLASRQEVTITATYDENGNVTTSAVKVNNQYTQTVKVANSKGAVLPGTGGIGTTIFYVVGGLLMFGAAVLLITKKRMGSDK